MNIIRNFFNAIFLAVGLAYFLFSTFQYFYGMNDLLSKIIHIII